MQEVVYIAVRRSALGAFSDFQAHLAPQDNYYRLLTQVLAVHLSAPAPMEREGMHVADDGRNEK